jgi:4-hydroxybenzoate polyprenyltransferase
MVPASSPTFPYTPADRADPPWILEELRIAYRFIGRDVPLIVAPALLMAATALHTTGPHSALAWARGLGGSVVFSTLFLSTFCLGNQIVGVEEDAINKPARPIPSGLVTLRGAQVRWAAAMIALPLSSLLFGGVRLLLWALASEILFLVYDRGGLHRHWLTKNLVCVTPALLALLAGSWQAAAPLTPDAWRWILFAVLTLGITMPVQDLRDVEGDRRSGRTTLSMSLGERPARALLGGLVAVLPVATHFLLIAPLGRGWRGTACEVVLAVLNVVTAARVVGLRGMREDHVTYMIHTVWFAALVGSAVIVL